MMTRFRYGLVVGKFAPLHAGHERLLHAAQAQCEQLFIISYTLPEFAGHEPERREQWLAARFPAATRLVVTTGKVLQWRAAGLQIEPFPHNDAPDDVHRHFVAQLCLHVLHNTMDAVFTGEDYGDGFAAVLAADFSQHLRAPHAVAHVYLPRPQAPDRVSGTLLRQDIHAHRQHLAPEVYGDFIGRICLLGGESSGKSTLSAALAVHLGTTYVAEYGRTLWEEKAGDLRYEDLLLIAQTQIRHEEAASRRAHRYVVCDTSPLTTLFYCLHYFGQAEAALFELALRPYALVVLCAADFPFVQDGTRQGDAFRQLQHAWYQRELAERGIPYVQVTGDVASRLAQLDALLGR
ncbi:Trifunctional NAD biosynthesis/regulator protein NadR [Andreprevotia sp. IGB-42]|uniref:AAA family ATPase n=1 Tax=Andreprevotia sp. IGB-42 TaxID=2497473 RepID=UPI00157E9273|nr:AAA family ATPase [Andreprevotia sp. IGB-42]KAF0811592.1 Trifunctional NAD biosynthesis/regulator protein NadR [Andreprevotia sp. IGB-42]